MMFMMHFLSRSFAAAALALALMVAGDARAQGAMSGVPNAMQGFSQNRDQPIQIEAASLEMRDKKKEATFAGNVKVVQGDTTMTSKTLVVFYDSGPAPAPAGARLAHRSGARRVRDLGASRGHAVACRSQGSEIRDDAIRYPRTRRQFVDQTARSQGLRRGDAEGPGRDR